MGKPIALKKTEPPFSPFLFTLTIVASLSVFLAALALIAPRTWNTQFSAGPLAIVGTIGIMHLFNAFAEYFFHRYILHAPLVPLLGRFYRQHTLHHSLTRVVQRRAPGVGPEEIFVNENKYPIVDPSQDEASFFPWYTFSAFGLLWTPFLLLIQLFLPTAPIFLGGFVSIALSLFLYEILHAIEHLPLAKWTPLLGNYRWGRWWRMFYAFHLRHHADVKCNESISGFFGFPIADMVFGTWVKPASLYVTGTPAPRTEFESPMPCPFIRWLDGIAERRKRKLRTS